MIELAVNGESYTDFLSVQANLVYDSMANDFTFTGSANGTAPDFVEGDAVTIVVDGELILTGYIEEVSGTDQEGSHTVTYTGRDRTGDFIDGCIDIMDDLRASNTLTVKSIIEAVISHLGLDLAVIDTSSAEPFNSAEDIVAPEVGENALEFVTKYAKKRQVILSSTGDGDILIAQNTPTESGAVLQRLQGSETNNILTQNWSRRSSERFNKYVSRGQLDPVALNQAGSSTSSGIENQSGAATDSAVRAGRQKVIVESQSYSAAQLAMRAAWMRQLSTAKAVQFSCTAQGHRNSEGDLWQPNVLVQINSDVAGITQSMLLNSVGFFQAEGSPTVSSLGFVEKDIYTVDAAILAQKPVGDLNKGFL